MVAALTRVFGVHNLALAEDVVQEAFCRAIEVWKFRGVPENPSAWLMAAAKNCALDAVRRERTARTFAPELGRFLQSEWTLAPVVQELFGQNAIKDDLLRMMFSCCQPQLPEKAQVALVLQLGGARVQLLFVGRLHGELVKALGDLSADADGGRVLQIHLHAGNLVELRLQVVHDFVDALTALRARR